MTNNYNFLNSFHLERMKLISRNKIAMLLFFVFFGVLNSQAQVTTNSGSGLNATYADLASAITALNGATISSPVVITLDPANPQTAPVGGYAITAQGNATNTILIQGSGNTITASGALVAGTLSDAVFKLVGADYVTLQNFTMQENPANTTTVAGTNNMTEWGVALLYASTTNGAQNNTIQNNTISLNRTYANTFGIYSNSTHAVATPTTNATATTAAGGNHGLKIYTNAISNVNNGIVVVGPTAPADHNTGLDIGGASLATANTITNYGTTGTFSAYANVSVTVNGILFKNSNGTNVSYNTITSSVGGVTAGNLNGIQVAVSTTEPTSTFTNTINNNNISLQSGLIAGAITGITYPFGSASATSTLNINNNNFNNFGHTVAGTGAIIFISVSSTNQFTTINSNTFTNISVNTTGSVTFISQSFTAPATGTKAVNNNAIVTAFNKTGAGGTVSFIIDNGSTDTGAVSNCMNNNFSNVTLTGATSITGINYTDGGTAPTRTVTGNILSNWTTGAAAINAMNFTYWSGVSSLSNNTITNINGQGSITGITIGSAANNATSIAIGNNIINNLVSLGTVGSVTGIRCSNTSTGITISGNGINTLSTTGASAVTGIIVSGANATGTNVFKNKIYDLSGSNATSTVDGLLVSGGVLVTAYNNIIGDLRTPNANAANPLKGINITGGTTVNAYYNSVYLNGSSAGALFGSSAISVATGTTVNLRNNIFVNNSTTAGAGLAVAYRRSSTTLTSYAAASNNNLFYASNIFTDGTNTDATLAAYQTRVATRDAVSVTENPTFVSTVGANANFLHINTVAVTQLESGGATIATVTDDFDGDVRNATTPDIGADEFAGVQGGDITSPSVSHTVVANSCTGGARTISATITDTSGIPTSGVGLPVAYWSINAGAYTASTGVSMGAGVYNFSVGTGSVLGDVITYYFVAQDTAAIPNLTALPSTGAAGFTANPPAAATAPTAPFSYAVKTLNGNYTVGTGGAYTTLTAAVADYNKTCLLGAVTFSLINATYPSETFPITINQNTDASAVNTLTIKPAVGVVSTISGSLNGALFVLNGADYVNLNGSSALATASACLVGGDASLRELTIQNTNVGTGAGVISVQSGTNGAMNNVIKNVNVIGQDPTTTLIGISLGGNALVSTGTDNDNNRVENCSVQKAIFGIYSAGASLVNQNAGTVIKQNDLSATGANRIRRVGVLLFNDNGANVSFNNVGGIDNSGENFDVVAIGVGTQAVNNTNTTSGGVANAMVFNNKVSGVTNDTTYSAAGIAVSGAAGGANTIYNNMISGVISDGASGDFPVGIYVVGATGSDTRLYNNTVAMSGDRNTLLTPGTLMYPSFGIAITGTDPIVELKNNIIYNAQIAEVVANPNAKAYAIGMVSTTFVNLNSNYNDFFSTGAQDGGFRVGSLATAAGTSYATVALWATAVSDDANSVEIEPIFLSASDLHLDFASNLTLNGLGTPIATVIIDFDCEARDAVTPDMGADEFTPPLQVVDFNGANAFKLYPNPVNNTLNIEYTSDLTNVSVYNMLGQQVLTKKVTASSTLVDMSGLNAGTYLVKVEANDVSKTLKVVKQ